MTGSRLVDSSVWLEYLLKGYFRDLIESNDIFFLSAVSLFEIKKKLTKSSLPLEVTMKSINFIKRKSLVISIDSELAEYAAEISVQHQLGVVDSLIYACTLRQNAILVTLDNDFRGLKDVIIPSEN